MTEDFRPGRAPDHRDDPADLPAWPPVPPGPGGPAGASVDTAAVRAALAIVDEHLTRRPGVPSARGGLVAVVGEPGTGKTHLAGRVVERCHRGPGAADARAVYLDVRAGGVDSLYRRFVAALPLEEVRAHVRRHYADLAAAMIDDADLARGVARVLGDTDLPPAALEARVGQLGLPHAALQEQLRSALTTITGSADHALALSLLLHRGMTRAAWDWLRGEDPAPVLQERGLPSPATGDVADTAVFARLYARHGSRLVVVLDELDAVFGPDVLARPLWRLRRAIDRLSWAGALVFLLGSAEVVDSPDLGPSRSAGARIVMSGFDVGEAVRFVRDTNGGSLAPFDEESIGHVVELTGGHPGRVRELCGLLARTVAGTGAAVSESLVREAARRHFATMNGPRLAAVVRRVLERHSWEFRADHPLTVDPAGRVDFWVPVDDPALRGGAILIVDAVSGDDDVQELVARATALRGAGVRFQGLVVVANGEVRPDRAERIRRAFGREPLPYAPSHFDDDLASATKAMLHALDQERGSAVLTTLVQRLDGLEQGQTAGADALQEAMRDVADDMQALRTEFARSTTAPVPARPARSGPADPVQVLFDRVLAELDGLLALDGVVDPVFASDPTTALAPIRRWQAGPRRPLLGLGCAHLLRAVVERFRRALRPPGGGRPARYSRSIAEPDGDSVEELCTRYDEALRALPLQELDGLAAGAGPRSEELVRSVRASVGSLGDRVRAAERSRYDR